MSWFARLERWCDRVERRLGMRGAIEVRRELTRGMQADLRALADGMQSAPRDPLGDVVMSDLVVRDMCARLREIAGAGPGPSDAL